MSKHEHLGGESREIPVKVVSEFRPIDEGARHQRIAEKAYELYQCRGCCDGRDLDDWLEAERLIVGETESEAGGKGRNHRRGGKRLKEG